MSIFGSTITSASRIRQNWRRWGSGASLLLNPHFSAWGRFVLFAQNGTVHLLKNVLQSSIAENTHFSVEALQLDPVEICAMQNYWLNRRH